MRRREGGEFCCLGLSVVGGEGVELIEAEVDGVASEVLGFFFSGELWGVWSRGCRGGGRVVSSSESNDKFSASESEVRSTSFWCGFALSLNARMARLAALDRL